jgi:hypothetical protein
MPVSLGPRGRRRADRLGTRQPLPWRPWTSVYFHATLIDTPVLEEGVRAGRELWHDREQAAALGARPRMIGGTPVDVYEALAGDAVATDDPRGTSIAPGRVGLAAPRFAARR